MSEIESSEPTNQKAEENDAKLNKLAEAIDRVVDHAQERNARVVEALCFVSLLNSIDRVGPHSIVSLALPNEWNFQIGSNRAVAYIPCEFLFDAQRLPELAAHPLTQARIGNIFKDTGHVPALFWTRNELAARRSLDDQVEALGLSFRHVLGCPTLSRCISRTGVRTAYNNIWAPRARRSIHHLIQTSAFNEFSREIAADEDLETQLQQLMVDRTGLIDRPPAELNDYHMERLEQSFA